LNRFGTMAPSDLIGAGVHYAREGAPLNRQQAFVFEILAPIYTRTPEVREIYAPEGRILREGEVFRFPDLGDALERFAAEGSAPFYSGEIGQRVADFVRERGGTLSRSDMAAYRAVERRPVGAAYRGCEILTNPPPSSGGVLIAFALELLERLGRADVETLVAVMRAANEARGEQFTEGLREDGFGNRFLERARLDATAEQVRQGLAGGGRGPSAGEGLGSTTHLAAIDAEGWCATVTCSNGTGSSMLVPGTGVHVNNMLGEEDLNPHGFHLTPVGVRLPSMMSPTVVLREDEVIAGLGSAGSNRIRSAVVQMIVRMLADGMGPAEAIDAPRLHYEAGVVQAEPGVEEEGLRRVEHGGTRVVRWNHTNLFFGGVQAVARDPGTGEVSGAGDHRRGGAAAIA
jgi:gamma-glutamyltranspeptidase / glutathione hydrolase